MWNEIKQHIDKVHNNVKNVLARGSLNSVTNGKTAKVQVQLMAGETQDGIEFPQDYGIISNPPAGSQAVVAFFGGNRDHGTVLKAFHTAYAPKTLASGEVALYHQSGTIINLKADGSVSISSATGMAITTPTLTVTGNLVVTGGNITAATGNIAASNGDLTDRKGSIDTMRGDYNTHTHGGGSLPSPLMT